MYIYMCVFFSLPFIVYSLIVCLFSCSSRVVPFSVLRFAIYDLLFSFFVTVSHLVLQFQLLSPGDVLQGMLSAIHDSNMTKCSLFTQRIATRMKRLRLVSRTCCTRIIFEGSNTERYKTSKHLSSLENPTSNCASHTCSDISHGRDWSMNEFSALLDLLIRHDARSFRLSDDEDDEESSLRPLSPVTRMRRLLRCRPFEAVTGTSSAMPTNSHGHH